MFAVGWNLMYKLASELVFKRGELVLTLGRPRTVTFEEFVFKKKVLCGVALKYNGDDDIFFFLLVALMYKFFLMKKKKLKYYMIQWCRAACCVVLLCGVCRRTRVFPYLVYPSIALLYPWWCGSDESFAPLRPT